MTRNPVSAALPWPDVPGACAPTGSPSDPAVILRTLPLGASDWPRVLGAILRLHNHLHSSRAKGVSFKTMLDRQRFLHRFFHDLRHETRFRDADPRALSSRHVEAMVARWLERELATASLHNYLSFLRTFAAWIGKPAMVREPAYYFGRQSPHARRVQVATSDKSWTAHGIDIQAKIAEVAALDPWVGLQLELCAAFGMRPKEARHFRPHVAVLPRELANPRDVAAFPDHETFVRIHHGTKGGRPRDVPIVSQAQRELLARAAAAVAAGAYVGRPGRTAQQNQDRFYYVLKRCGVTQTASGVVAHGLRHQHANDAYESASGYPSPVRGGASPSPQDKPARQSTARLLGHNRPQVVSCYLGRSVVMRSKVCKGPPAEEPDGAGST